MCVRKYGDRDVRYQLHCTVLYIKRSITVEHRVNGLFITVWLLMSENTLQKL